MPPEPIPLPSVVQGANIRPVGDERRGYGTRTARKTMERLRAIGINTLGILVEGRMSHRQDSVVQGPTSETWGSVTEALLDANALGFATVLVPHLYVDDGTWRGDVRLVDDGARTTWWRSYGAFIETAAGVAEATGTTVLTMGVELKGLSSQVQSLSPMSELAGRVRGIYSGLLSYSANWDEAEAVGFWPLVDIVGVNGYYPLVPTPDRGAEAVARRLSALARETSKDVLVVEVGFRSSPLSHVEPWTWPEQLEPVVDEESQAQALAAVLTHWVGAPGVRGLMVWVIPTDPDDPASEPRHGFNPLNKKAEGVLRRAFNPALGRSRSVPGSQS